MFDVLDFVEVRNFGLSVVKATIVYMDSQSMEIRLASGVFGYVERAHFCLASGKPLEAGDVIDVVKVPRRDPLKNSQYSMRIHKGIQGPIESYVAANPVGSKTYGVVKNVKGYGVFLTLAPGISCLLHKSQFVSFSEYDETLTGRVIEVQIVGCDVSSGCIKVESIGMLY